MGYWNPEIRGFQPQNNKAGTLFEYTDEQIFEMFAQGNVTTGADGRPVVVPRPEPTAEELKEKLRVQRKPLLEAFDKWEKAVLRGREDDDNAVMDWYQDLLDLKEQAFENVPERIEYYLEKYSNLLDK